MFGQSLGLFLRFLCLASLFGKRGLAREFGEGESFSRKIFQKKLVKWLARWLSRWLSGGIARVISRVMAGRGYLL
jgi:hypothetical protein